MVIRSSRFMNWPVEIHCNYQSLTVIHDTKMKKKPAIISQSNVNLMADKLNYRFVFIIVFFCFLNLERCSKFNIFRRKLFFSVWNILQLNTVLTIQANWHWINLS